MLNLIAGIDHATSGRVAVGGEEVTRMSERELAGWRARISAWSSSSTT